MTSNAPADVAAPMEVAHDDAEVAGRCPECNEPLTAEPRVLSWCAACQWNLGAYDRKRVPARLRWRWAARLDHQLAYRLNARESAAFGVRPVNHRASRVARLLGLAVAPPMMAAAPASLVLGSYLIAVGPGISPFLGLVLVPLAVVIRPRVPRLSRDAWVVDRAMAPAFFALLERVAASSGAPVPQAVILDPSSNAFAAMLGVRRRLLGVGLPLWSVLSPQQRVALLAHEMGHLVNNDVRRSRIVYLAHRTLSQLLGTLGAAGRSSGWLLSPFLWVLSIPLWLAYSILVVVARRDGQRAEYLADEIAARVAGTEAIATMLDTLLTLHDVERALIAARGDHGNPASWRAAAEGVERLLRGSMTVRRQQSIREQASLFASHPPTGLRASRVRRQPHRDPALVLTAHEADLIDGELSDWYRRLRIRAADEAERPGRNVR